MRIKYNQVCKALNLVHWVQRALNQVSLPSLPPSLPPSTQLPLPEERAMMGPVRRCGALPQLGNRRLQGQMGPCMQGPALCRVVWSSTSQSSACQVLSFRSRLSPLTSFSLSQWLIRADCGLLFSLSFSELPTGFFFSFPRAGLETHWQGQAASPPQPGPVLRRGRDVYRGCAMGAAEVESAGLPQQGTAS